MAVTCHDIVDMRSDVLERFATDPLVAHSAQFGLARPAGERVSRDAPSPVGVRPWNLRGMQSCGAGLGLAPRGTYDHARQCSVNESGTPIVLATRVRSDPTANSVSNNDGDEGASEDYTYDYAPDFPGLPV